MENNKIALTEQLTKDWDDLRYAMNKNHKINFEAFEKTFSETYVLLAECSKDNAVDKRLVALIVNAYLFANCRNPESDFFCAAAFSLTERMLACCALEAAEEPVLGTTVYVFETRKEVYINFSNVKDSINKLAGLFRENYWDNL